MKLNKRIQTAAEHFNTSRSVRWTLLVAVTAIFVLILHPRLVITTVDYKLGDIADRDIKAPQDFFIENQTATEASRQRAREAVLTVYDYEFVIIFFLYSDQGSYKTNLSHGFGQSPYMIL